MIITVVLMICCKGRVNVFYGNLVMKHERMPVNKFIHEKKFIGIKYASSWENCTQSQSDFCYRYM